MEAETGVGIGLLAGFFGGKAVGIGAGKEGGKLPVDFGSGEPCCKDIN